MVDLLKDDGFFLSEALLSVFIVSLICTLLFSIAGVHQKMNETLEEQWSNERKGFENLLWDMEKYSDEPEVY